MANSLHDPRYRRLVELIVAARKQAGLTQREVATRLKQHASYIGKIESRQRRLDLVELIDLIEALGLKPSAAVAEMVAELKRRR